MKKRILINLILIFIAFLCIEIFSYNKTKEENNTFKKQADKLEQNGTRNYKTKYTLLKQFSPTVYRNSFIDETNKNSILWFGCSFAEGAGLTDEQTPCYKISKLTNRNCINKSKGATGTQFMLYQLQNNKEISNNKNVDYIIYTFIWNHLQRLYNYQVNPLIDMFNLRYEIRNGVLTNITPKNNPIYSSYFIKRLLNKKVFKQAKQEQIDFKLFNAVMEESMSLTKKHFPNSKFIMIEFPDLTRNELPEYEIKKLEEMGISVVKVTDFTKDINIYDKKYWLPDDIHPTEEAWDLILPYFAKEYIK